jgi:hypothetical protein
MSYRIDCVSERNKHLFKVSGLLHLAVADTHLPSDGLRQKKSGPHNLAGTVSTVDYHVILSLNMWIRYRAHLLFVYAFVHIAAHST